jgi:hypothetical protein
MLTIAQIHLQACEMDEDTYMDPESGYMVLTSKAHLKRGSCCGNVCRHCPFHDENTPKNINNLQDN